MYKNICNFDIHLFVNDNEISSEDIEFMYQDDSHYCTDSYKMEIVGEKVKDRFNILKKEINFNNFKLEKKDTEFFFWDITDLKRLTKKSSSGRLLYFINTIDKILVSNNKITIEGFCTKIL